MESKKLTKPEKKRFSTVDAFLIVLALALLLGLFVRVFSQRLTGLDYTQEATVTFKFENAPREAVLAMRSGETVVLLEDGSDFGVIAAINLTSENGGVCNGSGTLTLQGADTKAGFLTQKGHYVLPFERYAITNGRSSFEISLMAVEIQLNE